MNVALWSALALVSSTTFAASPLEDFGWFAEIAGSCWHGTFPDGVTQHSHCYTTQFDRFVRGTAELTGRQRDRTAVEFAGDSVFAWDAPRQRIVYYIWGSDGSHGRYEAYYDGNELVFPVESTTHPGTIAFRSVWHRIDPGSFEVRREVPDGDGWKTQMTVLYERRALAPNAGDR